MGDCVKFRRLLNDGAAPAPEALQRKARRANAVSDERRSNAIRDEFAVIGWSIGRLHLIILQLVSGEPKRWCRRMFTKNLFTESGLSPRVYLTIKAALKLFLKWMQMSSITGAGWKAAGGSVDGDHCRWTGDMDDETLWTLKVMFLMFLEAFWRVSKAEPLHPYSD